MPACTPKIRYRHQPLEAFSRYQNQWIQFKIYKNTTNEVDLLAETTLTSGGIDILNDLFEIGDLIIINGHVNGSNSTVYGTYFTVAYDTQVTLTGHHDQNWVYTIEEWTQ